MAERATESRQVRGTIGDAAAGTLEP